MLKKVLAGTFLMAFIVINGVSVYADNNIPDKATPIVNIDGANIIDNQKGEGTLQLPEKTSIVEEINLEDQDLESEIEKAKKVEIFEPEDKLITTDKVILLSGKGIEGTRVLIEVYSIPELTKTEFDFDNLPESDTYILSFNKIIKIGPSGVFGEELELKQGLNKIIIYVIEGAIEEVDEESNQEYINEEELSSQEVAEEQNIEEDSNLEEENISEDVEKTKIVEKYVYMKDISQAKEKLDSIKEPGFSQELDIPSKLD